MLLVHVSRECKFPRITDHRIRKRKILGVHIFIFPLLIQLVKRQGIREWGQFQDTQAKNLFGRVNDRCESARKAQSTANVEMACTS